jgi:hypothetical protein
VDMVSKIDLSVKLDEDSVDGDEEMESSELRGCPTTSVTVKDEEACSPQPERQAPSRHSFVTFKREGQALHNNITATGSDRSTVEDDDDSPPSSPNAGQLKSEVTHLSENSLQEFSQRSHVSLTDDCFGIAVAGGADGNHAAE